ncbi:MAG: hypothetical protein JW801_18220 [Bacteroidales bacterium]|nr:hypothetical protein [Bacteroidales bacterium]
MITKKRKSRMQYLVLLVLIQFQLTSAFAQDSYINGRCNIKAGYARYKGVNLTSGNTTGHYRLEINYGLSNHLEGGAYIGTSKFNYYQPTDSTGYTGIRKYYYSAFYGINLNYHILPYFVESDNFRFDAYLTGKFGGALLQNSDGTCHKFEYSIGLGAAFYLFNNLGLFVELNVGDFIFEHTLENDYFKSRYGITFKF